MTVILQDFYSLYGKNVENQLDINILNKYQTIVPNEILELWIEGGIGSYMNDFFWVVNPEEYNFLIDEIYTPFAPPCIVFARNAFGDLFTWEKDCIKFINIRHGYSEVIGRKPKVFFNNILTDSEYFFERIKGNNFYKVKEKLGHLEDDECYGYTPLLGVGGDEKVKNLQKVKIKEYISLIAELTGKIE